MNIKRRIEGIEAELQSLSRQLDKLCGHVGTLLESQRQLEASTENHNARMIDHESKDYLDAHPPRDLPGPAR